MTPAEYTTDYESVWTFIVEKSFVYLLRKLYPDCRGLKNQFKNVCRSYKVFTENIYLAEKLVQYVVRLAIIKYVISANEW